MFPAERAGKAQPQDRAAPGKSAEGKPGERRWRQVRGRRQAGQREETGQANNEALSFCCEDFPF